jgi:NAD(P)-dependent dehydrogenase (short-subunit alcohol dehydrogenase family)
MSTTVETLELDPKIAVLKLNYGNCGSTQSRRGIIRTPLIGAGADSPAKLALLGRVGEPDEISEAALYLARAAFVTGVVLDIDGGYAHGR